MNETERGVVEELARVIYPEAYGLDAYDIVDDVPAAQAEARLYATRVSVWLVERDRAVSERAVESYALAAGRSLLALLPKNPHRPVEGSPS